MAEREYLTVMIDAEKHYFAIAASVEPAFATRMGPPGSYNRRKFLERGALRTLRSTDDPQRWAWISPDYAHHLERRAQGKPEDDEEDGSWPSEQDAYADDWWADDCQ